jgi:hypothetical protein
VFFRFRFWGVWGAAGLQPPPPLGCTPAPHTYSFIYHHAVAWINFERRSVEHKIKEWLSSAISISQFLTVTMLVSTTGVQQSPSSEVNSSSASQANLSISRHFKVQYHGHEHGDNARDDFAFRVKNFRIESCRVKKSIRISILLNHNLQNFA